MSEGWNSKIGEFERVNVSLQVEMAQLQRENEELKGMVRKHRELGCVIYDLSSVRKNNLYNIIPAGSQILKGPQIATGGFTGLRIIVICQNRQN